MGEKADIIRVISSGDEKMMKVLLMSVALALTPACTTLTEGPQPAAESTVLDEKAGILATEAYTAASTLGYRLAVLGAIDREKFKDADTVGYMAVQALREAYLAGNAVTYAEAIARVYEAVAMIRGLL